MLDLLSLPKWKIHIYSVCLFSWTSSLCQQWGLQDKVQSCLSFSGVYFRVGHPRLQASFCVLDVTYTIPDRTWNLLVLRFWLPVQLTCSFVSGGILWVRNFITISLRKLRDVSSNRCINRSSPLIDSPRSSVLLFIQKTYTIQNEK